MENTYFLVVTDGGPYKSMFEFMQRDITTKFNGGFVCDKVNRTKAKIILLGDRAKKYSMGMLDFLTYEENNLYKAIESASASYKNIVVIFNNSSLFFNKYFPYTLKKYKRRFKNLKYVLLYTDIVSSVVSSDAKYLMDKNVFDLVYSIDDNDVKKYGLLKTHTTYSIHEDYCNIKPAIDMYFCGGCIDREDICKSIAKMAIENNANAQIDMLCTKEFSGIKEHQQVINYLSRKDFVDYPETLKRELNAKCMLDIVRPNQIAYTLRTYEAIVYNRKILTNNKAILDLKFYDPEYIQYFENADDIDWDWVKRDIDVDYGYNGEFSPVNLVNDIYSRLF